MRFGNREYRIALIVITVVLALPILMHVVNGMNSRMLADDYCFAANAQGRGFAGTMTYYFYNWQGTFSSTAVQSAIALAGGHLVQLVPLLLIVGWWVGLSYLIWQLCVLLGFQSPRLSALALATLTLYAILEGTPSVYQSIYWISGSVTYTVPMVLFTLLAGFLLQISRITISLVFAIVVALIAGLCAGLLAGFSPIFAVFELGLTALLLLGLWFRRPMQLRVATIILGGVLAGGSVGTLIMIAAPGNAIRQTFFEKPPSLLGLVGINLLNSAYFIGIDLSAFSLLPALILLVIGGWIIGKGVGGNSPIYLPVKRSPRKWLLIALGVGLLMFFGIFLPTSYNISGFPPGRALIIPHVVMVALALTWGGIMALSTKRSAGGNGRISVVMVVAMVVLLLIGAVLSVGKLAALSPQLQTFAREWDARDALIRQTKNGSGEVSVPPFTVDLADYAYVATAEGEFVTCLQNYYHIQRLVVQK